MANIKKGKKLSATQMNKATGGGEGVSKTYTGPEGNKSITFGVSATKLGGGKVSVATSVTKINDVKGTSSSTTRVHDKTFKPRE